LTLDTLTEKYATISIGKKCTTQANVTPVHLACINPNAAVLKALLDQAPDFNMMDTYLAKPIHYAAACESSGPLKLLL
jgi:ankyrin repeat protein